MQVEQSPCSHVVFVIKEVTCKVLIYMNKTLEWPLSRAKEKSIWVILKVVAVALEGLFITMFES